MNKKNALLSVYHKEGIVEFGTELWKLGWTLYASGRTAEKLASADIPVTDVAELVGGKAILGHRVVTLSREVHAGLLVQDIEEHLSELEELGLPYIDLVCVDVYPVEEEIAKEDATFESVIEQTDIGGPTMLSAGAKGQRIVICDPNDRMTVIKKLKEEGDVSAIDRQMFAAKADAMVARYRLATARFHSDGYFEGFVGERVSVCKYGENGYQKPAALYTTHTNDPLAIPAFKLIQGTSPSYNNFCDADRLVTTMTHIAAALDVNDVGVQHIAVGVKHGNSPCASVSTDPYVALEQAIDGDPRDIFGGLFGLNFPLDAKGAEILLTHKWEHGRRPLDGILAPSFTEDAIELLKRKKDKCRLLANPELEHIDRNSLDQAMRFRYVRGGFLLQPNYSFVLDMKHPELSVEGSKNDFSDDELLDILLARAICETSNSNTITLVNKGMVIGNGTGGTGRVTAAKAAIKRARDAGHNIYGATAASDSFFPFEDGPLALAGAGVRTIMTTSGSIRDKYVKESLLRALVTLVWIPDSVGRGFYGH